MRIVLDTNILIVSVSRKSNSNWLFQEILKGNLHLCLTNDILNEYEEMLTTNWNATVAQDIVRTLTKAETVEIINVFFRFNLIPFDEEDNMFVDCAVAANADYLLTNDKHFNVLNSIPFPVVNVIGLDAFEKAYRN